MQLHRVSSSLGSASEGVTHGQDARAVVSQGDARALNAMAEPLYDEFGNYIGPELSDDENSSEVRKQRTLGRALAVHERRRRTKGAK